MTYFSLDTCNCPPSPSNGYVTSCSESRSAGDYIYHYCNSGYGLVGNYTRRCEYGGDWSGSAPVCLKSELINSVILLLHTSCPLMIPIYTLLIPWNYKYPAYKPH